jgi:preprotein translocase SecE subunit
VTDTRGGGVATTEPQPEAQPATGGRGSRGRRGPGFFGWLLGRFRAAALFYRQVVAELRKVIWPNRKELITYTIVALVFVTVMVIIVTIFDVVFAKGVLQVFG